MRTDTKYEQMQKSLDVVKLRGRFSRLTERAIELRYDLETLAVVRTYEEISKEMGLSPSAVGNRLRIALRYAQEDHWWDHGDCSRCKDSLLVWKRAYDEVNFLLDRSTPEVRVEYAHTFSDLGGMYG